MVLPSLYFVGRAADRKSDIIKGRTNILNKSSEYDEANLRYFGGAMTLNV